MRELFVLTLATKLSLIAFAGQVIAYAISMALARHLGVDGFEAYVVASAVFILMVTVAPRGVEKYTLRELPALLERNDWGLARGLLHFGLHRTLLTSLIIGLAVGAWACLIRDFADSTRLAIIISCIALPAGALLFYGVELLSALGREASALALFRLAIPAMTLAFIGVVLLSPLSISGPMAVACWGIACVFVLALMAYEVRRMAPPRLFRAEPIEQSAAWRKGSQPFLIYRISLALLAQAGVLALDWLQPSHATVGAYAAAMATAALVAVLASATNRSYARQMSILIDQKDFATLLDLRKERLRWLLPALAMFLLIAFMFTRELLGLFRPEFVDEGLVPLRLLAFAIAFSVLFSLAPTYLKYRRRNRATFVTVSGAAATQAMLLIMLVPRYGAVGAAIAYAISMCGMYAAFACMAQRDLALLKSDCTAS
jgi:O-antigen/teichoic acid export membrane protein